MDNSNSRSTGRTRPGSEREVVILLRDAAARCVFAVEAFEDGSVGVAYAVLEDLREDLTVAARRIVEGFESREHRAAERRAEKTAKA